MCRFISYIGCASYTISIDALDVITKAIYDQIGGQQEPRDMPLDALPGSAKNIYIYMLVEWGSNRKYTCKHTRKMVVLNHKATRSKQETFRAAFPLCSLPRVISVHPVNVPHPSVATCLLAKMSYAVEIQEIVRQRKQTLLVSTKIPWLWGSYVNPLAFDCDYIGTRTTCEIYREIIIPTHKS